MVKNDLIILRNEQFGGVRVMIIENTEPLFCLDDVAKALGYSNPVKAVRDYCKETVVLGIPNRNGIIKSFGFGKISKIDCLIIKSDLSDAGVFRDWIYDEVLPLTYKYGTCRAMQTYERDLILFGFYDFRKDMTEFCFADTIQVSRCSYSVDHIVKMLQRNGIEICKNRLFLWMRNNGYLCQSERTYNQPTQKAKNMGLFELKYTTMIKDDLKVDFTIIKVTNKGRIYFMKKLSE